MRRIKFMTGLFLFFPFCVQAQFWSNSGTNVYLSTLGNNVGIGTTTATSKLHVVGNGKFTNGAGPYVDIVPGSNTSLELGSGTASSQIDFKGSAYLGSDFRGRIVYTEGTGFSFHTYGATSNKVIINENGYLGVGISPAFPFYFQVEGIASKFSSGGSNIVIAPGGGMVFTSAASPTNLIDFKGMSNMSASYMGRIKYTDGDGMYIYTAGHSNPDFSIKENGKVTIGNVSNVSNDYKLFVETGILTERVKVAVKTTGDWSDDVFEPGYELIPVDSVSKYININCHLPEIPSATEVVKSGIDLGEMDAKLLQKIEELTLYVIQLNEANKEMKHELEQLKKATYSESIPNR